MAAPSDDIMTIEALATYLQISKSTLYKLVQDGRLPGQKVGKRWRFHKEAIDQWLKQHPDNTKIAGDTRHINLLSPPTNTGDCQ